MKKSYTVDSTCNDMRLDRWIRLKVGKIPQGLIEKYLRSGKIKINKKKIKSSIKVKTNDIINFFNLDFKETIIQKKIKFEPSKDNVPSSLRHMKVNPGQHEQVSRKHKNLELVSLGNIRNFRFCG